MKLLTATKTTQGRRPGDFDYAVEGELVYLGVVCDRDRDTGPDGGCGCRRAFAGLNSHLATTTAMVRDLPGFTLEDLIEAMVGFLEQAGWAALMDLPEQVLIAATAEAADLAEMAASHPVGTVMERRGEDVVLPREVSA